MAPLERAVPLPERLNMARWFLLDRLAEGKGARTALIAGERKLRYEEVADAALRTSVLLRRLGVRPEERVAVALPDVPEFVYSLFGAFAAGAVGVMLNPSLREEEIEYFLEYTRARALVVSREHLPSFEAVIPRTRHLAAVLVLGGGPVRRVGRVTVEPFEPALGESAPDPEVFDAHRDDAALWLFSGGTTGRPKAVVQGHGSFVNTTVLYAHRVLGFQEDDVTVSVPKLHFGYATGTNLLFPFSVGAASVLFPERPTPERLFELVRRHRATVLVNVPTMVQHLVSHPEAADADLSSLRLSTSAGEALPAELHARWTERFGVELLDGLGTAEMWHVFLTNRPGAVRPGTLGQVVPGFEVRVVDDEGAEVAAGEVGWLRVRGHSRALGYWQLLDKTAAAFLGEWYASGDMVRRDADGWFTYCGRGDDMLKVGGKWLAPAEVENCLLRHPWVREAAVVGVQDAAGLVKPHAHVELRDGVQAAPGECTATLRQWVAEQLEPYKAPRAVIVHARLPRTHLGKVDRGALRRG